MAAPAEALTEQEQKTVQMPTDKWSDTYALKIAKGDFERAEKFRQRNHDWRFRIADEIYLAWVQQRVWEGTKQPRSSLGVFLALEHIESLLPKILSTIFSDDPPFQVIACPGTKHEDAMAVQDVMRSQMEEARMRRLMSLREVIRRAIKSACIYGNGVVELCQHYAEKESIEYRAEWQPVMKRVNSIFFPNKQMPVGKKRVIREEVVKEIINLPLLKTVSIKDYYIDPNCPTPDIQDARFDCVRRYLSIDEIKSYADRDGFSVPDDAKLIEMAKNKPNAESDWTKANIDVMRGQTWQPGEDTTEDPAGRRIECVAYTTKERMVWMLNREHVMFNQNNTYGFIPRFGFWYVDVPDRWHALGVCDLVEGDQRLVQALRNGRVDEVALALHPSTIKRRGASIPQSMFRRRPGNMIEVENPKEDLVREEVSNITQNAYIESEFAERHSQKTTGITDLTQGLAPTGGNSAMRTATGVNTQMAGTASRIQYLNENQEDSVFEPILYAWHELNRRFLDPMKILEIAGKEIDPVRVKNARVQFVMRASSKLMSKMGLLQALPTIAQIFLNPSFMQQLAMTNQMKVNVMELGRAFEDATGYKKWYGEFFIPLTPEDQQRMAQPPPEEMLRMQMQRERLDSAERNQDEKSSAEMMKMVGEKIADSMAGEGMEEKAGAEAGS